MQLLSLKCCTGVKKMSEDLRVIKTKHNIESHFIELLEKYKFQDITIKLLISECQINRSTFYRNYEYKYDLINKISNELIKQFEKVIYTQFITSDIKDEKQFKTYFMPMLNYFNKYKREFLSMYNNTLPINIFDELLLTYSHYLLNALIDHYHIQHSQIKTTTYFSQIIASNILTAIKWWHLESPETSKEDMLKMISITITNGIFSSMESQFRKKY